MFEGQRPGRLLQGCLGAFVSIPNGRAVGPQTQFGTRDPGRWPGLGKLLGLWPVKSCTLSWGEGSLEFDFVRNRIESDRTQN